MSEVKAVVFDIDGTLSPEISWTALTRDLGASVEAHQRIFEQFRTGEITYETSREGGLLPLWKSTDRATKESFRTIFRSWPLREGAEELVHSLKARGLLICLITGSFDLYAKVVAERLGADAAYGTTQLVWDEQGDLITYRYTLDPRGKKKREFLLQFCTQHHLTPGECVAIGDSENDTEIFRATRGIAFGESPEALNSEAWKTAGSLSEIDRLIP